MSRAFIGTGLIGAGLAEAASKRGDSVVVWNRTRSKAEALARFGAEVADTPAAAVAGCARVHLALTSDPAVDSVLEQLEGALEPEAIVIDHTTTSPEGTAARAAQCAAEGVRYLHVPVFMSPVSCREATGIMMVSGPRALYDEVAGELDRMTGKVIYWGEEPDRAATFKLVGNGMLLALLGGLSDVFTIADEHGIAGSEVLELFESFDLRLVVRGRGRKMADQDHEPLWTLQMARKDIGLMLAAAHERELGVLPALAARMDALIDAGEGERDAAVLARDSFSGRD